MGFNGVKRTIYKFIEKIMCKTATHITVASYKNMEVAAKDGVLDKKKSSVIGAGGTVGVDLSVFDFSKRGQYKFEVQKEYPVLEDKIVFGYVGRIETDKGINELLMAFQKTNNPDFALLMIGRFDDLRCDLDPEILKWAKSNENVIFHGFSCEIPKSMSAMDILVHPTYREGFSMVIQQAMAMGCAIITTNVPGPSEVIEKGKSGLLVPDRTIDELSEAMQQLGTDRKMREKFSAAGLERVREYFERSKMLELTYENRLKMMNNEL